MAKIDVSASLCFFLPFNDREVALNEIYRSPMIERMLKDAPHLDRFDRYDASSLCEPCNLRREQLRLQNEDAYERRFLAAKGLVAEQFYSEASNHRSGLGDCFGESRSDRCKLFVAAVAKYGSELGFDFSKRKTRRYLSTGAKSVNDNWDLRWIFEAPRKFSAATGVKREDDRLLHVRFAPKLWICESDQPSPLSAEYGEILDINYYRSAPEFAWGYCHFFANNELEVCVKAHITLIGYVIDEIVSVLGSTLR